MWSIRYVKLFDLFEYLIHRMSAVPHFWLHMEVAPINLNDKKINQLVVDILSI